MLVAANQEYEDTGRNSIFGRAAVVADFIDYHWEGARYDFLATMGEDLFTVDGGIVLNSGHFGNYFGGYVSQRALGDSGVFMMHRGGDLFAILSRGWESPLQIMDDPLDYVHIEMGAAAARAEYAERLVGASGAADSLDLSRLPVTDDFARRRGSR